MMDVHIKLIFREHTYATCSGAVNTQPHFDGTEKWHFDLLPLVRPQWLATRSKEKAVPVTQPIRISLPPIIYVAPYVSSRVRLIEFTPQYSALRARDGRKTEHYVHTIIRFLAKYADYITIDLAWSTLSACRGLGD